MDNSIYVPILKWQQAEYQALLRLRKDVKDKIYPLVVVPPIGYDFEEQRLKKTIDEHLAPVAKRIKDKWGGRPIMVDLHESLMEAQLSNGNAVVEQLFNELNDKKCQSVPVVRVKSSANHIQTISRLRPGEKHGIAIRLSIEDLMSPSVDTDIKAVLSSISIKPELVDLIIDLGQPDSFEPYDTFANLIATYTSKISLLPAFRTFSIAGISLRLGEIKKPGALVERKEWALFKVFFDKFKLVRKPVYGDYSIEQPEFIQQDMRKMNPAGKIVYTTPEAFFVTKGKAFRGNESQMTSHCKEIINSGYFKGEDFSHGDKRISDTYHEIQGTGNLGVWKQAGISHHINKVIHQLANSSWI